MATIIRNNHNEIDDNELKYLNDYIKPIINKRLSSEDLIQIQSEVKCKMTEIKDNLCNNVNSNLNAYNNDCIKVISLIESYEDIELSNNTIQRNLSEIEPKIVELLNENDELSREIDQIKVNELKAELIDKLKLNLDTFDSLINQREYFNATKYLKSSCQLCLNEIEASIINNNEDHLTLLDNYNYLYNKLLLTLTTIWDECINASSTDLVIKPNYNDVQLDEVISSLNELDELKPRQMKLELNIIDNFLNILSPSNGKYDVRVDDTENKLTIINIDQILNDSLLPLSKLLSFIQLRYKSLLKSPLTLNVLETIFKSYLHYTLPTILNEETYDSYSDILLNSLKFQNKYLEPSSTSVSSLCNSWGDRWLTFKRENWLKKMRNIIKIPDFDTFIESIDIEIVESISNEKVNNNTNLSKKNFNDNGDDEDGLGFDNNNNNEIENLNSDNNNNNNNNNNNYNKDANDEKSNLIKVDSKSSITSPLPIANDQNVNDDNDDDAWGFDDEDEQPIDDDPWNDKSECQEKNNDGSMSQNKLEDDDDPWNEDNETQESNKDESKSDSKVQNISQNKLEDEDDPWNDNDETQDNKENTSYNKLEDDDPWNEDNETQDRNVYELKLEQNNSRLSQNKSDVDDPWNDEMDVDDDPWNDKNDESNEHFSNQSNNIIQNDIKSQQEDDVESIRDIGASKTTTETQSIVISKYVKDILSIINDINVNKQYVINNKTKLPKTTNDLNEELLRSIKLVIDLYRSLFPSVHKQTLRLVPTITIQFTNDLKYLSKFLVETFKDEKVSEGIIGKSSQQLISLRVLIIKSFEIEQVNEMIELINDNGQFNNISNNQESFEIEFNQIIIIIDKLIKSIKSLISLEDLLNLVGNIINSIFNYLIEKIEELQDISEDESKVLCKSLRILQEGVQNSYKDIGGEPFKYINQWFKLAYLTEILEANLVDLVYLYDQGLLIDFESEELVKLCKALFADTQNRAKAIDKISQY